MDTPKPTEVLIATYEQKTNVDQENSIDLQISRMMDRPVVVDIATADEADHDDEVAVLPLPMDKPVAGIDLLTEDLKPTPVITYSEATADEADPATPDEAGKDQSKQDDATKGEATPGEATPGEAGKDQSKQDDATKGEATPDEATPDEAGKDDEPISVMVMVDMPEDGVVPEGTSVWMTAVVTGIEPDKLLYQWQYSSDNESWTDIEGANEQNYEAVMTAANAGGYWRVTVSTIENEQGDEEA